MIKHISTFFYSETSKRRNFLINKAKKKERKKEKKKQEINKNGAFLFSDFHSQNKETFSWEE